MNREKAIQILKQNNGELKFKSDEVVVYCRGHARGNSISEAVENLVESKDLEMKSDEE